MDVWNSGHFTAPSRYFFQPNPGPAATALGQQHGRALEAAMIAFVAAHRDQLPTMRDGRTPAPLARAALEHQQPVGQHVHQIDVVVHHHRGRAALLRPPSNCAGAQAALLHV